MKFTPGPLLSMALPSRASPSQVSNPQPRAGFFLSRSCLVAAEALAGKTCFQQDLQAAFFISVGINFREPSSWMALEKGIQMTASHTNACPTFTWTKEEGLSELWKLSGLMWPKVYLPSLPPYCAAGNSFCYPLLFQGFHEYKPRI